MTEFLRAVLNSDLSISAVLVSLAVLVLVHQGIKKLRDVDDSKTQYGNLNKKLDDLLIAFKAEQESSKEMKSQFKQLKDDFKEQFMSLKNDFKNAFDDLHKLRNSLMVEQGNNTMNQRDLKELKEDFKRVQEKLTAIQAVDEYKNKQYGGKDH